MSEDKKIVSLADRRAERLAASQDEAFERGEVFRFEHIHLKEFHPGTTADAGAYEEKLRDLIRVVRCMPDATSARPTRAVLEKTAELIQTLERWGLIATVSPA